MQADLDQRSKFPLCWAACRLPLAVVLVLLTGPVPILNADPEEADLRVLFVGNSLTYFNDLPAMFERLVVASGRTRVSVESIAFPNAGLEDHWRSKKTLRTIDSGDWDFVVFQQGPSATEGRPSLLAYGSKFAKRVVEAGSRPVFYMVWPARRRSFDFAGVAESYRMIAERTSSLLLPVGEVWQRAWAQNPELPLYGSDGFHPSVLGSYAAALVAYREMTGRNVRDLPASTVPEKLRLDDVVVVQEAVADY